MANLILKKINQDLWLSHIVAPYLPILGAVNPASLNPELLGDVFNTGKTNKLLPYDKSNRWQYENEELIIDSKCRQNEKYTIITTEKNKMIKCYFYSNITRGDFSGDFNYVNFANKVGATKVVVLTKPNNRWNISSTTIFLLDITQDTTFTPKRTNQLSVRLADNKADFEALRELDQSVGDRGFTFLASQILNGSINDQVLIAKSDNQIAGAIGPLVVVKDNVGKMCLLPPYFGVKKGYRGRGIGRELWNKAIKTARGMGASYLTLQAQSLTPAEQFYINKGMKNMGKVFTLHLCD